MHPRTVWQALPSPRYPLSSWPWRSAGYLISGALAGAVVLVVTATGAAVGGVLSVVLIGLPLLALLALTGIPVAALERRRLGLMGPAPAPDPHRRPAEPGLRSWAACRFRERATWWELGYALLFAVVLWPVDALAVAVCTAAPLAMLATPVLMEVYGDGTEFRVVKLWTVTTRPEAFATAAGGLVLLLGCYALGALAGARAELTRLLLTPGPAGPDERVMELSRSRVRLVDAFEAERRRIERDLHDGAQQRIVALTMMLGLARLDAPPGPLADQLTRAHEEAGRALAELRELIHGIHPQVLADYGLQAAVADAAERSVIPVALDVELPGRLPEAVEAAAYFVACEALANVARHSGASRAGISGGHRDGRLFLEVHDDGRGGASTSSGGSGLTGLADRVSVLDGRLALSSPAGGPTRLRVEIPCEWTDRSA
ncbi:sensor domain-containing protein [Streptomyces sp. JV185]|uniref:sensor histidine kinase n=1 Tax=Streptomyces sp. JV185 TaxID=858638 RepID=UPI002E76B501|nr:sensor domain-containing protein [Streptomyces sp. JV185]MEE1774162.1 sensor domain-containing protein [Streptomyces sp. JV185]